MKIIKISIFLFAFNILGQSHTDRIVDEMVDTGCNMFSMQACFVYTQNRYVTDHCERLGWHCTSWEQRRALNALFCEGLCVGILNKLEKERNEIN